MLNLIPPIPKEYIIKLLPDLVDRSKIIGKLIELEASATLTQVRKRFFRLRLDGSPDLHLSYGVGLKDTYERSKVFNSALPQYTCKPVFIVEDGERHLFGQEFFEGTPIDEKYASNEINDEGVAKIVTKIQKTFSSLEVESTHEALLEEFSEFKETILSNNSLHLFDKDFLNKCVFPYLEDSLLPKSYSVRWSPGDLAARNILVDDDLNIRIIDCEFAHQTHFHEEDWIRLAVFSSGNFKAIPSVEKRLERVEPWYHIYLWLRQTWLNRTIWQNGDYKHFASEDLYTVLKLTESFGTNNKNVSLLIHGVLEAAQISLNEISIENDIRIQKENELDAEKQLRLSKENELDAEKQLRFSKENELDAEKQLRLSTESELDAEKQLRLSKENELDAERQLRLSKENELLFKKDKIVRMKNSFSWKSTSFLRFLRRKLLDPFQRDSIFVFDPITYLELNPDLQKALGNNLKAAKQHYLTYGEKEGRCFSYEQSPPLALRSYSEWTKRYDTISASDLINFKSRNESLSRKPLLSVIMPVYNPSSYFLKCAIDSVIDQIYDNWELCIVDDASTNQSVIQVLEEYANANERIKITFKSQNRHISYASNVAANMATGEYFLFLDHDDLLRPHSLLRIAEVIAENQEVKLLYSDEDKIDAKGTRTDPYFKPDWNPELLLSQNYLCHLTCCNADLYNQLGGFREGYEGAQDWDLFLRLTEKLKDEEIYHIPEILYHWRKSDTSTAKSVKFKSYVIDAARKTLQDAVARKHINAEISLESEKYRYWRIIRRLPSKPLLVSILIPTKDKINLLKVCLQSVLEKTDYKEFEIIILDNDSELVETLLYFDEIQKDYRIKVKKISGPFNYSAINNKGVEEARGDIIILLNNDIEVIERGWLRELVSHAIRPEIGCVGAKLLYPDDTIQHAGVILGLGGVAGHAYKGFKSKSPGLHLRLKLTQNYEAVTAACLAVRREVFYEVGGLDAKNLAVAFNDVDFCIRVRKAGYRNLWTPHALLYHNESASRGSDETPVKIKRFQKEASYMKETWGYVLQNDPTYNPNLTLDREDLSLSFPPRRVLG